MSRIRISNQQFIIFFLSNQSKLIRLTFCSMLKTRNKCRRKENKMNERWRKIVNDLRQFYVTIYRILLISSFVLLLYCFRSILVRALWRLMTYSIHHNCITSNVFLSICEKEKKKKHWIIWCAYGLYRDLIESIHDTLNLTDYGRQINVDILISSHLHLSGRYSKNTEKSQECCKRAKKNE